MSEANIAHEVIEPLIEKGKLALAKMVKLTQEQVDNIVKQMALAGLSEHMRLAKMAVEETKRGIYEDKIIKTFLQRNISTTV